MDANLKAPARQRKSGQKPTRSIRLCVKPTAETAGVVSIRAGKETADYIVEILRTDYGRGFGLAKIGYPTPTTYHVNIDGAERSCDCPGFTQHNHCKHADGLAALIAASRL